MRATVCYLLNIMIFYLTGFFCLIIKHESIKLIVLIKIIIIYYICILYREREKNGGISSGCKKF